MHTDQPASVYESDRLVVTLNCYESAVEWIAAISQLANCFDVTAPTYTIQT
jgi:hypothetical protein